MTLARDVLRFFERKETKTSSSLSYDTMGSVLANAGIEEITNTIYSDGTGKGNKPSKDSVGKYIGFVIPKTQGMTLDTLRKIGNEIQKADPDFNMKSSADNYWINYVGGGLKFLILEKGLKNEGEARKLMRSEFAKRENFELVEYDIDKTVDKLSISKKVSGFSSKIEKTAKTVMKNNSNVPEYAIHKYKDGVHFYKFVSTGAMSVKAIDSVRVNVNRHIKNHKIPDFKMSAKRIFVEPASASKTGVACIILSDGSDPKKFFK